MTSGMTSGAASQNFAETPAHDRHVLGIETPRVDRKNTVRFTGLPGGTVVIKQTGPTISVDDQPELSVEVLPGETVSATLE